MAGTLIINEKDDWLPAGWLFDNVLNEIVTQLPPSEAKLREILEKANTKVTGYADLRGIDGATFRTFVAAAERAYEEVTAKGAAAFGDPEFYPGYIARYDDLRAKLNADPRAANT